MIRSVLALAGAAMLTGCASTVVTAAADEGAAGSSAAEHTESRPVRALCGDAFPQHVILGWMSATVGTMRTYQHGGPVPYVPLRTAFPGLPATARGAWCIVRDGPDSSSLWGIAPGRRPRRAITVIGPGSGRYQGRIDRPPEPP